MASLFGQLEKLEKAKAVGKAIVFTGFSALILWMKDDAKKRATKKINQLFGTDE